MFNGAKTFFASKFRGFINSSDSAKGDVQREQLPFDVAIIRPLFEEISKIFSANYTDEVFINHDGDLSYVDGENSMKFTDTRFSSEQLLDIVWFLAWESKVRLDPLMPYAGGVVAGKPWRWHAVVPPVAPDGPAIVIRKQAFSCLNLSTFVFDNMNACDFARWLTEGVSIVFYGPTGSGKTSLLFAVMQQHFYGTRVGIVESVVEIPLISKSWFRLVEVGQGLGGQGGVSMDLVFGEVMRLSPRILVLGEIRLTEARILGKLAKSGHGGVMTTIHAGNAQEARDRLRELAKTDFDGFPKIMGVHVRRDREGRRVCTAERLV